MTFVARYEVLYGTECMTFNVHSGEHFVKTVRESGPLWATSAFPFEHNIHFCKKTLAGPKSPDQQIVNKSLNLLKYRVRPPTVNISNEAKNFCEHIFISKTLTKSAVKSENVTFLGPHHKNIFESTINKRFERCIYENRIYSSIEYSRTKKFNDTVFVIKNGSFVQITSVSLLPDGTCSFTVKQLIVRPFVVGNVLLHHIWEIVGNIDHPPVSISEVFFKKCVVLDLSIAQYVCSIPNKYEAQ